jgi:hypothetical protein
MEYEKQNMGEIVAFLSFDINHTFERYFNSVVSYELSIPGV